MQSDVVAQITAQDHDELRPIMDQRGHSRRNLRFEVTYSFKYQQKEHGKSHESDSVITLVTVGFRSDAPAGPFWL